MLGPEQRVVYFEHIVLGGSVKVTAIDSVTAVEVSIVGPASAAKHDLERLALRKLEARLKRDEAS
jgi:hypothetical protein